MFPVPLVTSSTSLTVSSFWDVVTLYHNRPHLVNRKLLASSQVLFYKLTFRSQSISHVSEIFTHSAILYELRKLEKLSKEYITENFLKGFFECYDKNVRFHNLSVNDFTEERSGVFISVRILKPRKTANDCIEIVILDRDKNSVTLLAVSKNKTTLAPPFPYNIELTSSANLRINLKNFEDADTVHAEWIADKLFPKLLKWAESNIDLNSVPGSLSLISIDDYCSNYGRLKSKYGDRLVKEWPTKANTDAKKYVFEDLAIASYLICLWNKYNRNEINFVDCGCGNGLLVYILNQEGYEGYGIDIRRRPTWDLYPSNTPLKEETVMPSSTFPNCTWIIGNHSDELTPWIPLIAIKSSPYTNIFVIPCCPYDLNGQKYARINTSVSQYSEYFNYITNLYTMCGFDTQTDKLRIPSTKRKCLVGIRKCFTNDEINKINMDVNKYVESRLSSTNFKIRSGTEAVRNCTKLNRDLIHRIVNACMRTLLVEKEYVKKDDGDNWNKGGSLAIPDLCKQVLKEDLKQLKEQCGGLQTLLRNHRYLFEIKEGKVFLRKPPILSDDTKKYKVKPCWFWMNHPDGCLHSSENCSYYHQE